MNPADYLKGDDLRAYYTLSNSRRGDQRSMTCVSCLSAHVPRESGLCPRCERMEDGWDRINRTSPTWRGMGSDLRLWVGIVATERKEYERGYHALKAQLEAHGIEVPKFERADD